MCWYIFVSVHYVSSSSLIILDCSLWVPFSEGRVIFLCHFKFFLFANLWLLVVLTVPDQWAFAWCSVDIVFLSIALKFRTNLINGSFVCRLWALTSSTAFTTVSLLGSAASTTTTTTTTATSTSTTCSLSFLTLFLLLFEFFFLLLQLFFLLFVFTGCLTLQISNLLGQLFLTIVFVELLLLF